MKSFIKISLKSHPFDSELLSGFLWELNPDGILEEDLALTLYFPSERTNISEELNTLLSNLKSDNIITKFDFEKELVEDRNWNEEWEKSVPIIKVSDQIVIKPSFKEYTQNKDEIIITIDPKMSFGTGEHQTTRIVIQLLEEFVKGNEYILDAGTGTGILAIAAVLLGAKSALGFDNDEWCLLNAKENVKVNNLSDKIEIRQCEISEIEETNFDIIVANIQKNVLVSIADDIKKRTKPNGIIILSGLLTEKGGHPEISGYDDFVVIKERFEGLGFKLIKRLDLDEWMGLVFTLS